MPTPAYKRLARRVSGLSQVYNPTLVRLQHDGGPIDGADPYIGTCHGNDNSGKHARMQTRARNIQA